MRPLLLVALSLPLLLLSSPLTPAATSSKLDAAGLAQWHQKAEQGDVGAQLQLATLASNGRAAALGFPHDDAEAARWYMRAAQQGQADAQYHLALAYMEGRGLPRNPARGLTWCKRAAENGSGDAYLFLADGYASGRWGLKDADLANDLLNSAADRGNAEACYRLGARLEKVADWEHARRYYESAAKQDHPLAQYHLAQLLVQTGSPKDLGRAYYWYVLASATGRISVDKQLQKLAKRMPPAQLATEEHNLGDWFAQREEQTSSEGPRYDANGKPVIVASEAEKWYLRAAEHGTPDEKFHVAIALYNGYPPFPRDLQQALRFYREAADGGQLSAQVVYARLCLEQKQPADALKYMHLAAEHGDKNAMQDLAMWLSSGHDGIKPDLQEALKWQVAVAEQGSAWEQVELAERFRKGDGVAQDIDRSWYWLRRAALSGSGEAEYTLAKEYDHGGYFKPDLEQAYVWYSTADTNHYPCAKGALEGLKRRMNRMQLDDAASMLTEWWKEHPDSHSDTVYGVDCP